MAIALKPCPMCRGSVELSKLEKVAGESGPLTITAHGMPVLKCAKGHASPVHADFLIWLIGELRERQAALPAGEDKGMLFKKHFCACGKELPAQAAGPQAFPYELAFDGAPAFRIELEAPVFQCAGCGKRQLRSAGEVRKALSHAMVGICDRAGFPHSG